METSQVKIICLIPARKGSQGVYKKNLRYVGFSTLVLRAIKVAKKLEYPTIVVLSTNDNEIIKRYSKKVDLYIERSPALSSSTASISDVILDTIKRLPNLNDDDLLVLLEPSSPNRNSEEINLAIRQVLENNYESLFTVSKLDPKFHPYKLLKLSAFNQLSLYLSNAPLIKNRQEINETIYYKNGIVYILRIKTVLLNNGQIPISSQFQVTERHVSNIDNLLDLWLARVWNLKEMLLKLAHK
jgi:CMP-N,N'-diacetyllegionaminic acid synthase